jgi:hypothetical protein
MPRAQDALERPIYSVKSGRGLLGDGLAAGRG